MSVYSIGLDPEEHAAQQDGQQQEHHLRAALPRLRRPHGQRHRQRAADQDDRVEGALRDVEVVARPRTRRGKRAVDDVRHEHPAEEHHFGGQEHPHAQRRGRLLLPQVVEVVLQRGVVNGVPSLCKVLSPRRRR